MCETCTHTLLKSLLPFMAWKRWTIWSSPRPTLFNDLTRDSIATTLLLTSTVDAYRFYTKLLFSIRSKVIKVWSVEKDTIENPWLLMVKHSEITLFFTCIFPYYVADEIIKEFWKSSHFASMRDGFLLRRQNSLR